MSQHRMSSSGFIASIYARAKLPSAGLFTVEANKPGFAFTNRTVETGTSRDRQAAAGNRRGIDFVGTRAAASPLTDANPFGPQPRFEDALPELSTLTNRAVV